MRMATKDISDVMVCEAYRDAKVGKPGTVCPYTLLQERSGQHKKVVWAAAERASDRGLVECGVLLRWGWLTDKGKALLKKSSSKE